MKPISFIFGIILFASCGFDTVDEAGIKYVAKPAFELPANIEWQKPGFAKELINVKENLVVLGIGDNAIPREKWDDFKPGLPWKKNIDRHLLIDKTTFLRSPDAPSNCQGAACKTQTEYKGYSWTKLACPLAIDYIPSKTDMLKPEKGHLVVKVIKKCQIVVFENEIYQMSDDKGNLYVMHATETGIPDLNVVLPTGFKIQKVSLKEPLVIIPFGDKEDCYFNIVGDHLGQGYHQYKYVGDYYPSK
jgi:hypothetical protein